MAAPLCAAASVVALLVGLPRAPLRGAIPDPAPRPGPLINTDMP